MLGKKLIAAATDTAAGPNVGWELANASFSGIPNFTTIAGLNTRGIFWKSDGTTLYVIASNGTTIYQYSAASAWDITALTYVGEYSAGGLSSAPYGLFISPDGTKVYFTGRTTNNIYSLALSTAWDITSASPLNSLTILSTPYGLTFKGDGTVLYLLRSNKVRQYTLSVPWDISTASLLQEAEGFDRDTGQRSIVFKPDGTKVYLAGEGNDRIYEYHLSAAWDVSTASYVTEYRYNILTSATPSLAFDTTGTLLYLAGNADLFKLNLVTAWDLSTASYQPYSTECASTILQIPGNTRNPWFKPDGTKCYIPTPLNNTIKEYTLSTPWELTTLSFTQSLDVSAKGTSTSGVVFRDDGLKMYVLESAADTIDEYNLSVAWDVSTASYLHELSVRAQDSTPNAFFIRADGAKMYMVGSVSDAVHEYDLTTPWDVTSSVYAQSFSVAETGSPYTLSIKPDGTKMFVGSSSSALIYEYVLSTPWDISTTSYTSVNYSPGLDAVGANVRGLFVRADGLKMFVTGNTYSTIYSFSL